MTWLVDRLKPLWTRRGALLLIALLALALRAHRLTFHSLEFDETVSVQLAYAPLPDLIANTINLRWDPHPPFYYSLLHVWLRLLGDSDFTLKWLTVLSATLTPLVVYALGRRLAAARVGLVAAALTALAPLEVYYAQQVRMFALIPLLTAAASYALLRAIDAQPRRVRAYAWIVVAALCLAALYTHFSMIYLLPIMAGLALVAAVGRRRWGRLIAALVTLAIVTAGYMPYLTSALRRSGVPRHFLQEFAAPARMIQETLRAFGFGVGPGYEVGDWTAFVIVAAVVLAGLLAAVASRPPIDAVGGRRSAPAHARAWLIGTGAFLTPMVGLYALGGLLDQPLFVVRYMLTAEVWLFLMLALAIVAAWRRLKLLGLLAAAAIAVMSVNGLAYNWRIGFQREDWRVAGEYLGVHAGPGDVILAHPHFMEIPLRRYYHGPASIVGPFGSEVESSEQIAPTLETYRDRSVVWLAQSGSDVGDPQRLVERWFVERFPVVTEQYPSHISIKGFALQTELSALPEAATPLDAEFDGRVRLLGYTARETRLRAADERLHPPSNWIHVTLYWQPAAPLDVSFDVWARLVDGLGQVWGGSLDRPNDMIDFHPPVTWRTGAIVRTDHDINLNPVTPPGAYRIEISLVDPGTENRWRAQGLDAAADRVFLQPVEIVP